jgi:hypothetical protein
MNGIWNYLETLIFLATFLGILWLTLRVCAADARRRGKSCLDNAGHPFILAHVVACAVRLRGQLGQPSFDALRHLHSW